RSRSQAHPAALAPADARSRRDPEIAFRPRIGKPRRFVTKLTEDAPPQTFARLRRSPIVRRLVLARIRRIPVSRCAPTRKTRLEPSPRGGTRPAPPPPGAAHAHAKRRTNNKSRRSAKREEAPRPPSQAEDDDIWELRLYIAGQTPNSISAIDNLKKICEER